MGTAREDYGRFVRWLHEPERNAREDVRKLANLVLANFDSVVATARQRNNRASHLAVLARQSLTATESALPEPRQNEAPAEWPWTRLQRLLVGPFRGFRRAEPFDLQKRLVLVYGPNGSGKTSLCDALEHALLGTVQEAEIKRIEQPQYLANIHARRFAAPQLTAVNRLGQEVAVAPNADTYNFCFIDKNRIEAFARIASRPPAARTELISALFGMEKFNDFANHFNDTMDQVLVLAPENQNTLSARRQALARDQHTISSEAATFLRIGQEEAEFANQCIPGASYTDLKAKVGTEDVPGRLKELNEILAALPPYASGITRQGIAGRFLTADEAANLLRDVERKLQIRSSQVSFKELYSAVLALQSISGDTCPACETPLGAVVRNPFEKAKAALQGLKELTALQEERARCFEVVNEASRTLRNDLSIVFRFMSAEDRRIAPIGLYLAQLPQTPQGDRWWQDLYVQDSAGEEIPSLNQLLEIVDQIELRDQASNRQLQERQNHAEERERLNNWQLQILERDIRRQRTVEEINAARNRVAEFEAVNAALIQRANREVDDIARDRPIRDAYDGFVPMLRQFRNELPGTLLA